MWSKVAVALVMPVVIEVAVTSVCSILSTAGSRERKTVVQGGKGVAATSMRRKDDMDALEGMG